MIAITASIDRFWPGFRRVPGSGDTYLGSGDIMPKSTGERFRKSGEFGAELPVSLAESIGEAGRHSGDLFEPIVARNAFFGGQRATALSEFEPWHEFPDGTTGDSEEVSTVGFGEASVALAMCNGMATRTMGPQMSRLAYRAH
jgi:hypothetical protein